MAYFCVPDKVSHNDLLRALALRDSARDESTSWYCKDLMHSLENLSRRAQLEVLVAEDTGMLPENISGKTVTEMMVLLQRARSSDAA